jgi:hypothetical protein
MLAEKRRRRMKVNLTRHTAGTLGGLLFLALSACDIAAQVEVAGLYGKAPSELAEMFPGVSNAEAGRQAEVVGWKGWKTVYLSFNGKRRLTSVTFVPARPISEQDAK